MDSEDPIQRRRDIIARIEAGESYSEIARDLGISRQAVFSMYKKYKELGEDFFKVRKRGRSPERDQLTASEKEEVHAWLKANRPADVGYEGDQWTIFEAKKAIFQLTKKRLNLRRSDEVLHYGEPTKSSFKPFDISAQEKKVVEEERAIKAALQKKNTTDEDDDWGLPSLEEMQRLNEECWKTTAKKEETQSPRVQRYGQRTGKHAKGKGSPTQKKRKKRK